MSNNKKLAAFVVAACGVASAASAAPTVMVGGNLDTQFGGVQQSKTYRNDSETHNKLRNNSLSTQGDISVKVDGTMEDSNFKYGGLLKFNANASEAKGYANASDASVDAKKGDTNILQQAMMYVETPFGKMEVGSTSGAAQAMQVGAMQAGAAGDWRYYVNQKTTSSVALTRSQSLTAAGLYTNDEFIVGSKSNNANKINLYTPEFMGFKLGVTYIPDLQTRGTSRSALDVAKMSSDANAFKNIVQGGIHYGNTFNEVMVKAAFLGETGTSKAEKSAKVRKLNSYEAGLEVSYMGFSLGGSYGSHGKTGTLKSETAKESKYWTIGTGYTYGPASASVTYLDSKKGVSGAAKTNNLQVVTFAVDYKLAEGFAPYASVTNFKEKNKATDLANNKGNVFLVGSKLSF